MAESIVRKFYSELGKGNIWGQQCNKCKSWTFPPKGSCQNCNSFDLKMKKISGKGKLQFYSVGNLPPKKFADIAPYAYGLVKLKEGPVFPTQIRGVPMKLSEIPAANAKCPIDVQAKIKKIAGMNIVIFEKV